uniref:Copia protein n=1 Tax=Tanacetum cinerariifolium TaxID=118510 RepID=A0A6L2J839_TANCI|nr:copia protein [Tanacetum cinerariifolium]
MESLSPHVVAAAKLPILNPNEFDLWKMRIEQYLLMTDYSLWEVILNGDSSTPTRVVDGVVQVVAPTTAEQKLAKKNELKARGTLLMDLPDKHQLKFNIHKDAKSLMEAIEKRFGGNKRQRKCRRLSLNNSMRTSVAQALKAWIRFMIGFRNLLPNWKSCTNESVSVVSSVSAASTKPPAYVLPNVDNLSDAVIYSFFGSQSKSPQLDNDDLIQIDADDLKEMDLKWQMAMLTMRARRFLQRTGRNLGANGTTSMGFDMSKSFQTNEEPTNYALMAFPSSSLSSSDNEVAPCTKACSKAYAALQSHYDKLPIDLRKSQFDVLSYKTGLEYVEARLVTSSKNLSKLLESQITDKTRLGYDTQVFNSTVFDCDELNTYESDVSVPTSPVHDRYKLGKGYHTVPPSYTGTFMPLKPNLVFHDASTVSEIFLTVFSVEPSTTKPTKEMSQSNRPSTPIIEDWVFDSKDEFEGEPMPTQKSPSFVQTFEHMKTPRTSIKLVEHPTQAKNLRKDIPQSKGHRHSWNIKACFVCKSVNHLIKDCNYYKKIMVQKPVWNHAMRFNHHNSARMTHPHSKNHFVPTAVLTRSRLIQLNAARPVITVVPQTNVTHQRPAKHVVNRQYSPIKRPINHKPAPKAGNFHQIVTIVRTKKGNPQQALKDKGVIDSGCSRHMTGNISYLFDFKEINGGYVAFGGNPKDGKITSKDTECVVLSSDFKLPDENHVLLRVPRENNMYNVDIKNVIPSGDLTCLFAKATLDEIPSIRFMRLFGCPVTILNTLDPIGKFDGKADEGFLVGYSVNSKAFKVFNSRTRIVQETLHTNFLENQPNVAGSRPTWLFDIDTLTQSMNYQPIAAGNQFNSSNTDVDATFDVKKNEFEVHVSLISSDKPKKHDENTKREAKGKSHEEDIDYEEVFPPVARIEAIRLFLAYASFMGFMVYQMDLKSSFLYGIIKEEVYVCQPPGFEDPDYPNKVYTVVKALYGLHQAPRAWYERLSNYLLKNGFQRGKIDQTFFIKKQKGNILLVQVYVNDIIFRSTNKELGKAFMKLIKDKFQISSMGELAFFLGLQVKQQDNGIFISQDKYIDEILRKCSLIDGKPASTPIDTEKPLLKDPNGEDVDVHIYSNEALAIPGQTTTGKENSKLFMADSLPITILLTKLAVKLLYSWDMHKYGPFEFSLVYLVVTSVLIITVVSYTLMLFGLTKDDVHLMLLGRQVSAVEEVMINAKVDDLSSHNTKYTSPVLTKKVFTNMKRIGKGFLGVETPLFDAMLVQQQVQDDAEVQEDKDSEVSAAPTPPSPTPTTTSPPPQQEPIPSPSQAQFAQPLSPPSQQPSHPADISESSMTHLNKLMEICATLTKKVANLEQDKIAQALEIIKLKQRVRKLEKKRRTKHLGLKRRMHPNRGKIAELDANKDITLVDVDAEVEMDANIQGRMAESQAKVYNLDLQHSKIVLSMQDTDEAKPAKVEEVLEVVTAAKLMTEVVTTAAPITTAAQVPKASAPRRRRGVVIQDPEETAVASVIVPTEVKPKDKRKGILIEEPKPLKRQAQIKQDEAFARQLEAELNANINWNDVLEDQKGRYGLAKVKSWKLFESCGVHINTLTTTQMFLLVEKKYPLTPFTLEQMINNVRLKVEGQSEMSLELLSFRVDAVEDFKKMH